MKKCPQCNSVYTFDTTYCLNDGTPLIVEKFPLPSEVSSDEEETLITNKPIILNNPNPADTKNHSNLKRYTFVLIIGLAIGGVFVLGAVFLIASRSGETTNGNLQVLNEKHKERNKTRKDTEFNGFVLSENANLRSAPNSAVFEALPRNDRLNVIERDGAWYRVMCEHGSAGWMHGNTIDWSSSAISF